MKIGTNKTWSVILKHTMHQITVLLSLGAIKTEEVKRLAQKYLEPIPAQPAPPKVHIVEPVQTGERRITVQKRSSLSYDWLSYLRLSMRITTP
jgi:predicted Zn-dependent peptidase